MGRKEKPDLIKKCISSWHTILPEFDIREWNEDNFNVKEYPFIAEAYQSKMYAFASDHLRYVVLKRHGGIFLDCDVELLKDISPLLEQKCFFAIESHVGDIFDVNPGLIIGCEPQNDIISEMLGLYDSMHFLNEKGKPNLTLTSPTLLTKVLTNYGYQNKNEEQFLNGYIRIYPSKMFDPIDHSKILEKSNIDFTEAYGVHWGAGSWLPKSSKYRRILSIILRRIFGNKVIDFIKKIIINEIAIHK